MGGKSVFLMGNLVLVAGLISLMNFASQENFSIVVLTYAISFLGYALILRSQWKAPLCWPITIVGLSCLVFFPNLSDDIYRFYWDGALILKGISPYSETPSVLMQSLVDERLKSTFPLLNSPEYYSIYPPVCQVFYVTASLISKDITSFSLILKSIYLGLHLLGYYFFRRMQDNASTFQGISPALYFLNPLVLAEGIGNLHIEIVMISFLIMFYYFLSSEKMLYAALGFAAAVAVKLLPLILLPYLVFQYKKPRFFIYLFAFTFVMFVPLLWGFDFIHLSKSANLYFQKFEFNASVYYLLRYVGKLLSGYNLILYIGPILGLITFLLIIRKSIKTRSHSLWNHWHLGLFAFTIFLLLATTVHPWYVMTIVFFGMCTGARYPIFWSFLIVLSYAHYAGGVFQENYVLIALEYAGLAGAFWFFDKKLWLKGEEPEK